MCLIFQKVQLSSVQHKSIREALKYKLLHGCIRRGELPLVQNTGTGSPICHFRCISYELSSTILSIVWVSILHLIGA
jgi:hypothetical protein